jgi:endonuclease/exonuclease/phosphatase family metal-dependent hydrolase
MIPTVRRRLTALLVAALLLVPAASAAAAESPATLTVMSRNLYLGADLEPVLTSTTLPELAVRAAETYTAVQATNFAERAAAIADEIRATRPDLIGLQEVALWRTDSPADGPATPAEVVSFDFLAILQQALEDRGLDYDVASSVTNFDGEVPSALGFDVRYTDHDVILARDDVDTSNPMAGNFSVGLPLPELFGGGIATRGWTSVDTTLAGETIRVVNTHPEAWGPDVIRIAQTSELLATALNTSLPVVLVGDLNTEAGSAPYNLLAAAGFDDAWNGARPGPTCCQAPDLRNRISQLSTRIDYVLVSGGLDAMAARTVGDTMGSRTPSGLWPSDHAGVVAKVRP